MSSLETSPYEVYKKFMSYPLEKRKKEVGMLNIRHPSKIPIIIYTKNKQAPLLKKCKFLVNTDITIAELLHTIRKYMELKQNESIFLFTENNTIPPSSFTVQSLYKEHKNEDGFMYLEYSVENTFG